MKVLVATGGRFIQARDGTLWTNAPGSAYFKWERYLGVFEEVILLVRTKQTEHPPAEWFPINGPGVTIWSLPYFEGPWTFLVKWFALKKAVRQAFEPPHAVILRAPHHVSDLALQAISTSRPFGAEIIGDPDTALAPGSLKTIARGVARRYFVHRLKYLCTRACAVAYVTKGSLQERYPAASGAFTTYYSSIELPEDSLRIGSDFKQSPPFRLFHAGSMTTYYKGQDILLEAMRSLLDKGWEVELRLAGDGPVRPALEKLSSDLGLTDRVQFLGLLPGSQAVQQELDIADLFVFPSRSEGLPRALLEAMSRGLPCIASRVGGIPEVLAPEDTIENLEPSLLVAKIQEVLSNPYRMQAMSRRNIETVKDYTASKLEARRHQFYKVVKRRTEEWLMTQPDCPSTADKACTFWKP